MGSVSTELIKQLRQTTGAGISECKKALESSDGDIKVALDFLREKGLATALKRSMRNASEGVVEIYSHGGGRVGVMLELNCETDFVGRSDGFRSLAHELALQIAATAPLYIKEEDVPEEVLAHECKIAEAKAREDGKKEEIIPKIVEGSLKKFKDEVVLYNQMWVKDESVKIQDLINQNIAALGENVVVRRYARYALGESSAIE